MADRDWQEIKDIYYAAATFFSGIEKRLGEDSFYGFKVLNSPPIFEPECFFVGFQPSGGSAGREQEKRFEVSWPEQVQYVECVGQPGWKLADRMVESFGSEYLQNCMGSNAIFMRWPDIDSYNHKVSREIREDVKNESSRHLRKLIEIVEPKRVVAIGFSVLELFGKPMVDSKSTSGSGRVLTRVGNICDVPATGMLHLSGCQISKADRSEIADRIKTLAPAS